MNLAIDIGNNFTHFGLFDSKKLIKSFNFPTNEPVSQQVLEGIKSVLFYKKIDKAGIASVVTDKTTYWVDFTQKLINVNALTIINKMKLSVKLKIENSDTLGADRICNSVFGYEYFKRKENVIVIDLGTANTYDVIMKNGDFIGGIIAPGIGTSAKAMNSNTSQLPLLIYADYKFNKSIVGKNTTEAIQSGLMNYALFATEGIVKAIEKEFKRKFKVIVTGGNAKIIKNELSIKTVYIENAVLEGINIILNYNK